MGEDEAKQARTGKPPYHAATMGNGAWILILESLLALGLLVFIVWWTWPRK